MSTTIDERVVEMRFDNKEFESNVQTSLSTLDKLKQSLNLNDASKSLENVGNAAKGINMNGLGNAVETVRAKFSALEVMAVTALANITNSVVNAGKQLLNSFTIEPINDGFKEYELKMDSVQTIMAGTGASLDTVMDKLNELNVYADKTIYSFSDMTSNIGKFTNAGVELDAAVAAIQGVANVAAVSGANANEASRAMYNFAQALSAGYVKLIDWKSIENANMATVEFKTQLLETAVAAGTLEKTSDGMYKVLTKNANGAVMKEAISATANFNDSLAYQWMTTEVLTETLGDYADETTEIGKKAFAAAQDVKTFSQLMDTLKEAAGSGWAETWELIVGDFEEAKKLFTELSDRFGAIIQSSADARNGLLNGALTSNWDKLIKEINGAGIETEAFENKVKSLAEENGINVEKLVEDYGSLEKAFQKGAISSDILNQAIESVNGGLTNLSKITEELRFGSTGDDVRQVQQALKDLGYDLGEFGVDGKIGKKTEEAIKAFQELNGLEVNGIIGSETITALEKASSGTKTLSDSYKDLVDNIDKLGGRELLIDTLRNTMDAIGKVARTVKEAWTDIFPPATSDQLYGIIEGLKRFSEKLIISDETADKLKRTLKGVFSIFDIAKKVVFSFGDAILKVLGSDGVSDLGDYILNTAASIGDFFTSINEGFDTNGLTGSLSVISSGISNLLTRITDKIGNFGDTFSSIGTVITDVAGSIWDVIKSVFTWITDNVSGGDVFAGLAGSGIFILAKKLADVFGSLKDVINNFAGGKDVKEGIGSILGDIGEKFSDVLDSVHGALESFTTGIKVGSIIGIAVAIGILSVSLKTISELDAPDIGKSLFAISAMLTMLSIGFRSMTKSLTKFNSKGIVKSGIALVLVAVAINVLATAMEKMSDLSTGEIAKGLAAIGGGLLLLSGALKIIGKTKISISTSIAMLALAYSCNMLGDALKKFAELSWSEIARGLASMGGALGEVVIALTGLSKVGGGNSLLGSVGIFITVQSLSDLADALKGFGEMSWDEIGRGLVGMGGALGEVGTVLGVLGKIAGFSSIFASGAILIVVQGLDDLAGALKSFGEMSWDEIGRGLVGMGGALGEVGGISGTLGRLTGLSGILGSGAILLGIQGLGDLADALKDFAGMTWGEIARGLVGMGGALGEVGGISGTLGRLTGLSGILGSGAILLGIQGLGDLADALAKFGEMSWDEIGRGLVGMGGALGEVAAISGTLGALTTVFGILGSGSLLLAIQGLGDLADAFKKFGEMNWDEIGRGLTAMGGALETVALGGFLNTLSIIGSMSISAIAEPLGTLANSVKKWADVTIPEGLGLQLAYLADGISYFTFSGFGASAIAEVAAPLGILADSIQKWGDVEVPEGLGDRIGSLADGISYFTFSGFGASAIAEVAAPLGTLADSVSKWSDIDIPEHLEDNLTSLANGVKAFTWAFMGGWSINAIIEPLGTLPDSIKKWNDVDVPNGLADDLVSLADGVKAFSSAFIGGWTLEAIIAPLGDLAASIGKWNNVSVPENLEDKLISLADGVKSFSWAFMGGWSIGAVSEPLGSLANAVKKWNGITVPSDVGDKLTSLALGVEAFANISDISYVVNGLKTITSTATDISKINFASINSGLSGLADSLKEVADVDLSGISSIETAASSIGSVARSIQSSTSQFSSAGSSIANSIGEGFKSKQSTITSSAMSMVSKILATVKGQTSAFMQAGGVLISKLVSGIKNQSSTIQSALKSGISSAVNSIRNCYSNFYTAGRYLGSGLVLGINSKKDAAYNAGYALGRAAVRGEKDGQASKSPSKLTIQAGEWLGEGLIIGINKIGTKVYNAGHDLGASAAGSMSSAISRISDFIDSGIETQPTIRPVLDLSDVKSGANTIGSILRPDAIGVMANANAISAMVNLRNQNGESGEIVSAINKLRKDLGNVGNTSYHINGITYDDGSNIAEAVHAIVRAARVERRV